MLIHFEIDYECTNLCIANLSVDTQYLLCLSPWSWSWRCSCWCRSIREQLQCNSRSIFVFLSPRHSCINLYLLFIDWSSCLIYIRDHEAWLFPSWRMWDFGILYPNGRGGLRWALRCVEYEDGIDCFMNDSSHLSVMLRYNIVLEQPAPICGSPPNNSPSAQRHFFSPYTAAAIQIQLSSSTLVECTYIRLHIMRSTLRNANDILGERRESCMRTAAALLLGSCPTSRIQGAKTQA